MSSAPAPSGRRLPCKPQALWPRWGTVWLLMVRPEVLLAGGHAPFSPPLSFWGQCKKAVPAFQGLLCSPSCGVWRDVPETGTCPLLHPLGSTPGRAQPPSRIRKNPVLGFLGPGSMECKAGRSVCLERPGSLHFGPKSGLGAGGRIRSPMLVEGQTLVFSLAQVAVHTKPLSLPLGFCLGAQGGLETANGCSRKCLRP